MGKKVKEYKSGDFIFAKVKGYPAWPARVQKPNGKKYFVYFYGTGETANLPPNMIFDYAENKDKFLNKSVKRKDFNDGVRQIDHDFANNVPLEQVIGALAADAEPAPADDTMNDSANDTMDDSAIADTTADETLDETANSTAVNDGPVEDSDETGALVIDEGKQKARKSTAKAPATPKVVKEAKAPRGRPRKEEAKEVEPEEEKKDEEIVSRSGRKIRPKRYMDEQTEDNATLPSPAPKKRRGASPGAEKQPELKEKEKEKEKEKPQDKNLRAYNTVQQSELRELKEPFKSADPERENILITYLPSGAYCGVKLFQSRPASFKSEASRLQLDKQAASNAITLKRQLEKGQITPQSISAQLVMDLNLTDEQKTMLDKDRDLEIKKSRLHFLKTEMKLIELDAKIKTCLSLEKADTDLCLKLIDEILELDLAALMLLKHPTCMETVKRMRVYVGNAPSWEMSESEALTFSKQAHRIRNKADALFITMRDLFDVPEGLSFWEYFNERVAQFKTVTAELHADKLLEMVHEPIEMTQPSSHTMKAAIDAANEDDAAELDEAALKKKATPAKGKKVNNTPSKTPLKRQSSRKQQHEEKESSEPEKPAEEPKEPETNDKDDTEKTDTNDTPKENDDTPKENDVENTDEGDTEKADKEVEKVNDKAKKSDEKEADTPPEENEKGQGDNEKAEDSPKHKESNSKEKADEAKSKPESSKEKTDAKKDKDSEEKEKTAKDNKKPKEDKNSSSDKNSKSKDKNSKDDGKSSKDSKSVKVGDKRKDKKDEKEKSEEKEKVDVDEPRAKRSRESKKTEPPPRSPAKRKSKS